MEYALLNTTQPKKNAIAPAKGNHFFQPKLTVNQPNDAYEQEADAMADKVMRMQQPFIQAKPMPVTPVQRKCAHCEEEEKQAQRKEINSGEATADSNLETYVGGLSGGGQPLSTQAKNFYEPLFGYDFSNVKVHTDTVAAKSAQSINAHAYTSGNNIVFNSGQYSPDTDSGKRLLGHELTHVVQQNNNIQLKKIQRTAGDGHDLKAERFKLDEKLEQAFDGEYIFKNGATGMAVSKLQQALVDLGYNLSKFGADGIYGNETSAAVRDYQTDKALSFAEIDGMVGPQTMGLLDEDFTSEDPVVPPNNLPECPVENNAANTFAAFEETADTEQPGMIPGITCQVPGKPNPKPGNNQICSKICGSSTPALPQKLTIGSNVFTLCPCNTGQVNFNSGAGHVNFVTKGSGLDITIDRTLLFFSTGFQGANIMNNTPAWEYSGSVAVDELIPGGGASRDAEVETGFIQKIESYTWDAKYANGWEQNLAENNVRDRVCSPGGTSCAADPWYGAPATKDQPRSTGSTVSLTDEPAIRLKVSHPDPDGSCTKLSEVSTQGKFHLWLIAAETANATTNLVFLFNASVEFNKTFKLKSPGADPSDSLNWVGSGTQTESAKGFGKGSQTPVLSTPVPTLTITKKTGTACAKEKK